MILGIVMLKHYASEQLYYLEAFREDYISLSMDYAYDPIQPPDLRRIYTVEELFDDFHNPQYDYLAPDAISNYETL